VQLSWFQLHLPLLLARPKYRSILLHMRGPATFCPCVGGSKPRVDKRAGRPTGEWSASGITSRRQFGRNSGYVGSSVTTARARFQCSYTNCCILCYHIMGHDCRTNFRSLFFAYCTRLSSQSYKSYLMRSYLLEMNISSSFSVCYNIRHFAFYSQ
jgi:hypothetical protein